MKIPTINQTYPIAITAIVIVVVAVAFVFWPKHPYRSPAPAAKQPSAQNIPVVSQTNQTPSEPKVLLDESGSGNKQTQSFTTSGNWTATYTFDCSNFDNRGNFAFIINNTDGSHNSDVGANELGAAGGNTDYYYNDPGEHYLSVLSECGWHITVKS